MRRDAILYERRMAPKRMLLIAAMAIGALLVVLGVFVIWNCTAVSLGVPIEGGGYTLMPPNREGIVAGVLMAAVGSIAVSVSLTLLIAAGRSRPESGLAAEREILLSEELEIEP